MRHFVRVGQQRTQFNIVGGGDADGGFSGEIPQQSAGGGDPFHRIGAPQNFIDGTQHPFPALDRRQDPAERFQLCDKIALPRQNVVRQGHGCIDMKGGGGIGGAGRCAKALRHNRA